MMIIRVDFKNKKILKDKVDDYPIIRPPNEPRGPLERLLLNKAYKVNYTFKRLDTLIYDTISDRYGVYQPYGGVIYKNSGELCTLTNTIVIDSYGRGCTSNAIGNPYRLDLIRQGLWNRPTPFPVDVIDVYKNLVKGGNVRLGLRSDPFAWIDDRFRISQELLCMFNSLGVKYTIHTASDLIAHEDYLPLINKDLCTIVMRMPSGHITLKELQEHGMLTEFQNITGMGFHNVDSHIITPEMVKKLEPGAPSLDRRFKAIDTLNNNGINVRVNNNLIWDYLT